MTRQAKMVSIMFAVLILIIVSEIHLKSKRNDMTEKGIKTYRRVVALLVIATLLSSFYFLTDSLKDFLIVGGLFAFLILYFLVLIKEPNIGERPLLVLNFSIWIVWFFMRNIINKHLLIPINYTIIIIFILNIIQLNSRKERGTAKKYYLANGLGILVLVSLILITQDSYRGISKQEYIAREYMMENYDYDRSDIVDIGRVEAMTHKEKVFISVRDSDLIYLLTYDKGKILKVEELK